MTDVELRDKIFHDEKGAWIPEWAAFNRRPPTCRRCFRWVQWVGTGRCFIRINERTLREYGMLKPGTRVTNTL